jgi:hypothetical protein
VRSSGTILLSVCIIWVENPVALTVIFGWRLKDVLKMVWYTGSQGQDQGAGLYLFCGHGGGTKAFSRVQVEELMYTSMAPAPSSTQANEHQNREAAPSVKVIKVRSSVVFMGCSSGKLPSNFDEDYIGYIGVGDASHSQPMPRPRL